MQASELPKRKSNVASFNAIKSLFNRVRNQYEFFLQWCTREKICVAEFPPSSAVSLEKMAKFSVIMPDNAAPATCTSFL